MDNRISTTFNVSYDVPRIQLGMPGRQNRAGNGTMRITPGATEPVEFIFGNQDGVALNLVPFQIKLVFWRNNNLDSDLSEIGHTNIVLSKTASIDDPYSGRVLVLLTDTDTMALGQNGARSLRWGVFMVATDGSVFPVSVTSSGARFGTVHLDLNSGIPSAELIRSL